jgi:hypothetical protein
MAVTNEGAVEQGGDTEMIKRQTVRGGVREKEERRRRKKRYMC